MLSLCPDNVDIYDIVTRVAGVSFKTVSRVLNDDPAVSDNLRGKIRETVKLIGYIPNAGGGKIFIGDGVGVSPDMAKAHFFDKDVNALKKGPGDTVTERMKKTSRSSKRKPSGAAAGGFALVCKKHARRRARRRAVSGRCPIFGKRRRRACPIRSGPRPPIPTMSSRSASARKNPRPCSTATSSPN